MMSDYLDWLREWGPPAMAVALLSGVVLGNIVRSLKVRLWLIAALILLPPLTIAALYWRASSAPCSEIDCESLVLGMVYVVGFAIFPICLAIGMLLGSLIAGVRRKIDRWVTPQEADATPAG